ncbi:MAG: tetratricopeptide repeat protein [Chloroflexota bacterium]|nr:tetratricopeptide repeat protein [Chloroflexota bacterium]
MCALCIGVVIVGCSPNPRADTLIETVNDASPASGMVSADSLSGALALVQIEPTPTVAPGDVLLQADRLLLNGIYSDAILTYQVLLRQPGMPLDAIAAAYYGIGRGALREGLFQEAADHLTLLIDNFPTSPRHFEARFLRGEAYLGLSRWSEAIADFDATVAARPGILDSYAYERIADAQVALGQTDAALASYVRATSASRGLTQLLALRERVAQVLLSAGRPLEAVAQYDAILSVAQNAPYRADIGLRAARALIDANDTPSALIRLNAIVQDAPDTAAGYEAIGILRQNAQPVDDYVRGRSAFAVGDYRAAVDALNRWASGRSSVSEIPAAFHLQLGQAYRAIDNVEAAVTAFQTIIDTYPTDPLFGAALLEQGRTRFLSGDDPGAIGRYITIADTYGYLPEAAEALWRAAYLYSTNDQPTEGNIIFERLADAYPNTPQAIDGLFIAAANAYRVGSFDAAERYYAELGVKTTGEERATAYFWLGRLAARRGDTVGANQAFNEVIAAAPDSYFAARSRDLVTGAVPFVRPAAYRFSFDTAAEIAESEAWLRATFPTLITQEGALWMLAPALAADARLLRGTALWSVGAVDEANAEFGDLVESYEDDPLASYQLAIALRDIGAYYNSVVAASYVIRAAGIGTLQAPGFIARMRYPAYYRDLVEGTAARYDFDPLLLFSLIRHESLFNTYATAAAGEIGLTQVIPGTAQSIAEQIAFPDYQHADLFKPYAGIAFGAHYLNEQLDRFDQNAIAALAGYNAGPGRAIDWLALSGGDPDQFMTAISIPSTRTYVERIYGYHAIYKALYGAA